MKKHGLKLFLLLFLLMANAAYAADREKLIYTGHPSYAPVSWEEDGAIVGASARMIELIARDLGIPAESKSMGSWAKAQEAIKDGNADIIFGIYYNDVRAGYMYYLNQPYMVDPVVLMVRKGKTFPFHKWSDLVGRKGVTNEGESYGPDFDGYMADQLEVARGKGMEDCYQLLLSEKADYLIAGLYPGIAEAEKLNIMNKVEAIPKQLKAFEMFVAFSKKSLFYEKYHRAFEEKIREMVDDGTVQTLLILSQSRWEKAHCR